MKKMNSTKQKKEPRQLLYPKVKTNVKSGAYLSVTVSAGKGNYPTASEFVEPEPAGSQT